MKKFEKKHRGYAMDRFGSLPDHKTRVYDSEFEAHIAAEKLCKKYFGERGHVTTIFFIVDKK